MRKTGSIVFIALIGSAAGCGRPPNLANGPIDLTERPTTVRFIQPVSSSGHTWELCFEFDLPGGRTTPRPFMPRSSRRRVPGR